MDKSNHINPARAIAFGDGLKRPNHRSQTSVYIKSNNGHSAKLIRITSNKGSRNLEIEYREERYSG